MIRWYLRTLYVKRMKSKKMNTQTSLCAEWSKVKFGNILDLPAWCNLRWS